MSEVTRLLKRIDQGDSAAAAELLPLVYEALRSLARQRVASESPGQTLQATALVHEAYLRLVGNDAYQRWDNRGHFFAAAAEAMRRILVENARRKAREKHGGLVQRTQVEPDLLAQSSQPDPYVVLAIHEALDRLAEKSPRKAELVKLRYFAGCTIAEAAQILGIAASTAEEDWTFARAWLKREWLRGQSAEPSQNSGKSDPSD